MWIAESYQCIPRIGSGNHQRPASSFGPFGFVKRFDVRGYEIGHLIRIMSFEFETQARPREEFGEFLLCVIPVR
jgi:hypothetical protein